MQASIVSIARKIVLPVIFFTALLIPPPLRAQTTPTVIITELYPAPTTGQLEWIELFNPTASAVNLAGWWLSDELSSPSVIHRFLDTEPVLQPHEFRIISLTTAKLNNSGDGVQLFAPDGTLQSRLVYSTAVSEKSQQRVTLDGIDTITADPTPGGDNSAYPLLQTNPICIPDDPSQPTPSPTASPTPTDQQLVTTSMTPTPTPSPSLSPTPSPTPTVTPTPTPTLTPTPTPTPTPDTAASGLITISEVLACPPSGEAEWIELYNAAAQPQTIDFKIVDRNSNFRVIKGTLPASGYGVFRWSGSLLNNTGDAFELMTSDGHIVDTMSYETCTTGQSFVPDGAGEWRLTSPTPGSANILSTPTPAALNQLATMSATLKTPAPISANSPTASPNPPATTKPANTLPNFDPRTLSLTGAAAKETSAVTQTKNTGTVLGSMILRPAGKPWWAVFVIMAGVIIVTSGLLPHYGATLTKNSDVGDRLAAAAPVGWRHLLP